MEASSEIREGRRGLGGMEELADFEVGMIGRVVERRLR